ncbi:MAG TPA: hypothetical protein VGL39_27200 [Jatrophihabitantaceae bacterium]|jgi:hypothetical protein
MNQPRSEDELRAAFAAKATEAPQAEDVLRAVRREVYRPPARRRWLAPAVATAVIAAIGIPLGIGLSHGNNTSEKKAGDAAMGASSGAGSGSAAAGRSAGTAPRAARLADSVCRPSDVTVTVRRDAAGAAILTVTSRGTACRLDRVPRVQWTDNGTAIDAQPESAVPGPSGPSGSSGSSAKAADQLGVLPAGSTATATVRWAGNCGQPAGDVVRVDWGAGTVEAHAGAETQRTCARQTKPVLRVSAFTGLS